MPRTKVVSRRRGMSGARKVSQRDGSGVYDIGTTIRLTRGGERRTGVSRVSGTRPAGMTALGGDWQGEYVDEYRSAARAVVGRGGAGTGAGGMRSGGGDRSKGRAERDGHARHGGYHRAASDVATSRDAAGCGDGGVRAVFGGAERWRCGVCLRSRFSPQRRHRTHMGDTGPWPALDGGRRYRWDAGRGGLLAFGG